NRVDPLRDEHQPAIDQDGQSNQRLAFLSDMSLIIYPSFFFVFNIDLTLFIQLGIFVALH
ncbi:MAG: hypothetical protein K0M73_01525, partial [Hydrogenophaga sp.]|nr:hypothetical protein [Hydrogenophaga sp.]